MVSNVYNGFLFLPNLQTFDPNITVSYYWYFHLEIVRTIQDLFSNIYHPQILKTCLVHLKKLQIKFELNKSPKTSKSAKIPKNHEVRKCSKILLMSFGPPLLLKKTYILSFWMPRNGYFPHEILESSSQCKQVHIQVSTHFYVSYISSYSLCNKLDNWISKLSKKCRVKITPK